MFKIASWTSTGKELIARFSDCAVISLCCLNLFVFLSRMVSGEGLEFLSRDDTLLFLFINVTP